MRGTIFLLIFLFLCGSLGDITTSEAQNASFTLDKTEVEVLKKIGSKLNVTFWDFTVDPCSASGNWMNIVDNDTMRNVTCDCNSTTGVCHVIGIQLKSQNLTGVLPDELVNLTSITQIDLTRNHITGPLPPSWASLPNLAIVGFQGNQLSGGIPDQFGNIKSLRELVLENNRLEGPIPSSLGNLSNLTRLLLSANFFTGPLPESLGKLKNLQDFRIDGNAISGKIPSFLGNWTALTRLDMQGTSLEGPFPSTFTSLAKLSELRVTDINIGGTFPDWENMNFKYLFLRNCSLSGQLPSFIANMDKLKRLDLSFNNFTGEIPSSFANLSEQFDNMYLTNNMLSGRIPPWILENKKPMDLSYNSFNVSPPNLCQSGLVNTFGSFSTIQNISVMECLSRNHPCPVKPMNYNLFINCGGPALTSVDGKEYMADTTSQGQATSVTDQSGKWAFSSTGDFVGESSAKYTATNVSRLNTSDEVYQTARLSPMSLRYHGFCMQNGNYQVNLHFAEITLTDDKTFSNNGRRIFDVSIQGKKVLQNFNIAERANGTGRGIVMSFSTDVNANTLEIHFQWLGKGTNAIPARGVYGPLISAISVTPNFKPDLGENKLSSGAIAGIVVGSCAFVLIISVLFFVFLRKKNEENKELREELQLQTGYFSLRQIKSATQNFSPENKIGEGGFGPVFKGELPDGSLIAVKQLSAKSKQGNREFVNEIGMISALQHPNLVKLYGCCVEGNQLLLIYEYLENNSLARALFGPEGVSLNLDWQTRCKICMGIARGLAYLHEESVIKIVHRDIKATNVLLDKDLNAKISDFGLAKLDEEENTHISTRIAGTVGYMAPEYAMRGYLTDKADVYSFGIVVLEIVSGKSNTNYRPKEEFVYLLDWAYVLQEQGNLLQLVDPCLGSKYSKEEAEKMLNIALLCTNISPTLRPSMSTAISMLEGQTLVTAATMRLKRTPSEVLRFKAFENLSHDSQVIGVSTDVPWTNSTVSSTSNRDESTSHLMADSKLIDFDE